MSTLIKNGVTYFVRDPYCLGRSCLDLGPNVEASDDEKGLDVSSSCRTMLVKGCPRELPTYDAEPSEKRGLIGVRLGRS
jgi:hypothetical protein